VSVTPDQPQMSLPVSPCSRCGGTEMRTVKIPRSFAFWDWFMDGTSMGGTHEECTRCGLGRTSWPVTLRHRRQTPLGIPKRVIRTLLDHRSREPVPVFYVEVLVAGTVVGVVLDAVEDIPWWLPPLIAVPATWLYYLSSAFSGPRHGTLERDLKVALRPSRASELHDAETERAFRDAPFVLLGLDESWTGDRWLGGFATRNGDVSELHLGHSRETAGDAQVVVGVQPREHLPQGRTDVDVAVTFAALNRAPRLVRPPGVWQAGDDEPSLPRLLPRHRS
jgi:hypothetical protein